MPGAIAEDRCDWTPGWTETNSHSYWLREAQVQSYMYKPGPGYWCNLRVHTYLGKPPGIWPFKLAIFLIIPFIPPLPNFFIIRCI